MSKQQITIGHLTYTVISNQDNVYTCKRSNGRVYIIVLENGNCRVIGSTPKVESR